MLFLKKIVKKNLKTKKKLFLFKMVEIDLNEKDNADISNVNNSILYLINYFLNI